MAARTLRLAYLLLYNAFMAAAWATLLGELLGAVSTAFGDPSFELRNGVLIPGDYLAARARGTLEDKRPVVPPAIKSWGSLTWYGKLSFVKPRLFAAYWHVRPIAVKVQSVTLLETLHAALGIVRSAPSTNALQWLGRTHCVAVAASLVSYPTKPYASAELIPALHAGAALVAITAWCLSELVRYPWAAVKLLADSAAPHAPPVLRVTNDVLTYLRYTAFIVLYPVGFLAEEALLISSLPHTYETDKYDIEMPNAWNFAFHYRSFLWGVIYAQPIGFIALYMHMWDSREKKLAPVQPAKPKDQ